MLQRLDCWPIAYPHFTVEGLLSIRIINPPPSDSTQKWTRLAAANVRVRIIDSFEEMSICLCGIQ